MLPNERNFLE
jgi:hypothetical protein